MDFALDSIAGSTGLLFGYTPTRTTSLDPRDWEAALALLVRQGFDRVDFSEMWSPITRLDEAATGSLTGVLERIGAAASGLSLVRIDFSTPEAAAGTTERVLRGIRIAAQLGAPRISLGIHTVPTRVLPPSEALGYPRVDDAVIDGFVGPLRALGAAAADAGVELSLEMHENTVIHRSSHLLALLDAIGSPAVGANPDLGNLLRETGPIAEDPIETIERLAGRINYWHVKNGVRFEIGPDTYRMFPTSMGDGSIDYRTAVRLAVAGGFRGPLVVEHYGGDVLSQAASGVRYLRGIITELDVDQEAGDR